MGSFQIKFYQERKGIDRAPYVKGHLPTRIFIFFRYNIDNEETICEKII